MGRRYVVAFADFALIRHWRATFPTRGKAFFGCTDAFESALKCGIAKKLAQSARPHPALRATFPLEGEGYCGGTIFLCSTS